MTFYPIFNFNENTYRHTFKKKVPDGVFVPLNIMRSIIGGGISGWASPLTAISTIHASIHPSKPPPAHHPSTNRSIQASVQASIHASIHANMHPSIFYCSGVATLSDAANVRHRLSYKAVEYNIRSEKSHHILISYVKSPLPSIPTYRKYNIVIF